MKDVYPSNKVGIRFTPNNVYNGMGSEDNFEMFSYVFKELNSWGLAYVHVVAKGKVGENTKFKNFTLNDVREFYKGFIIGNGDETKETA